MFFAFGSPLHILTRDCLYFIQRAVLLCVLNGLILNLRMEKTKEKKRRRRRRKKRKEKNMKERKTKQMKELNIRNKDDYLVVCFWKGGAAWDSS